MLNFGNRKAIRTIAIAIALLILALAVGVLKKCKNNSQIKVTAASGAPALSAMDAFLSFQKRDFAWPRRFKKDGYVADFDLFTGPFVYKENGKIALKTYDMVIVDDTFPLYLAEIRPKPYRLKIEGYSKSNDDDSITIMFRDIETNKCGECAVNNRNETLQLYVRAAELREEEEGGIFYEFPEVKVYDEVAKKDFVLTSKQKIVEGEYIVIVRDINGNEYVFRDFGKSVKIGEASCTLRYLNVEEGAVRLLLVDATGQEFNKTIHLMR